MENANKYELPQVLKLGLVYRKSNTFLDLEIIFQRMKNYKNVDFKVIDITDVNLNEDNNEIIPSDLDAVTLPHTNIDVLSIIINKNKNLKWVHSMSSGVDAYLKVKELKESDIYLTNSRGAYGEPLAEYGINAMLYFSYNGPLFRKKFQEKTWANPKSTMLKGKTLTIVGYGWNGIQLAKRAKLGLEMKVLGVKRKLNHTEGSEYIDGLYSTDQLSEILPQTDFLLNFLPHTKDTENLFDYSIFSKLKSSSVFINLGRGSAVVEEDLIKCLKEKTIAGAALDVTKNEPLSSDSPFFTLENVFLSFHSGDNTQDTLNQTLDSLFSNLDSLINKKQLLTAVDKNLGY